MLTSPTMKTSEKWMMMEKRPITITIVYGTAVPNKIYYTHIYRYIYIYIYIYTHIVNWVNLLDKIIVPPDLIKLTTEISS